MAGVLFVDSPPKANHISSIDANDFDTIANFPGYRTGLRPGCCSLTLLQTTSSTTSMLGAKTCSLSVTINKLKARKEPAKGVLVATPKEWSLTTAVLRNGC